MFYSFKKKEGKVNYIDEIMKNIKNLLCSMLVALLFLTGCQSEEHKQAIAQFETISAEVTSKNEELDQSIEAAEIIINAKETALDETLYSTLESSISNVKAAKIELMEQPKKLDDLLIAIDTLSKVDYSDVLKDLKTNQEKLERSIYQFTLVNNPKESYVISCLKKVPNVIDISAVTEENDPNGNLNKPGGYTAQVFFSSDLLDQSQFTKTTVIEKGTTCGGSVEVYTTVDYANKRNDYLSAFDGSIISSGSHSVIGTVVVRTSDKLTASQQKKLEANIIAALTEDNESIKK